MTVKSSTEGQSSIHLDIPQLQKKNDTVISPATMFELQNSAGTRDRSSGNSVSPTLPAVSAPEKKLTLFALRLAVFEKTATGLGTLGFIWATAVLLGGLADALDKTDFWFITIILLIEGARIFSRSHELEWQHQSTRSIADAGVSSFRMLRSSPRVLVESVKDMSSPVSSYAGRVFLSRNVSKILYWLQLLSAIACVVLSLMKLIKRNFGYIAKRDTDKRNGKAALYIFYGLALAEALVILTEKLY